MSACPLPFESLAATNACPTAHEAAVVQHQIDNLELKRPGLLRLLAQAQLQLHDLDTKINSLKPILAPVRRLPLEILGEIFLMVSPNPKTRPGNYQRALTSLILVCKSWRDAAYLAPRLWCDIRVKMDTPSLSFDSLGQWIRRAGKVPKVLEISLSNCGGVNYGTGAYICAGSRCLFSDPILATLLTQSVGTWFSVTLNCPTSICLRNFALTLINATKQPGSRWDCVRSFTVVANSWPRWMTDRHRRIPSDFSFIPTSVTDLDLQLPSTPPGTHANSAWRLPLQIPPAVLDSLSTLKLVFGHDEIVVSSIFLALQHCERLEKLMIDFTTGTAELLEGMPDGMEYDGWSRMEASGVHLPRLQSLQLSGLGGATVESSCWYILKMPRLVELSLEFRNHEFPATEDEECDADSTVHFSLDDNDWWCDGWALSDLIGNVRSQLRSLRIKGVTFWDDTLSCILRDLPSVTEIRLERIALMPCLGPPRHHIPAIEDLEALMENKHSCFPNLKTLVIHLIDHLHMEVPHLRPLAEGKGIDLKLTAGKEPEAKSQVPTGSL